MLTHGNNVGLSQICYELNNKHLNKSERMSNWENNQLRDAQKIYAALDAYILIEIKENFDILMN